MGKLKESLSKKIPDWRYNYRQLLDEKGDNVRLFFMPTEHNEKIVCINPLYIGDEKEYEKLNTLIGELEEKFQLEVD